MSLALVMTGILFRLVALYKTIVTLRNRKDWRLFVLAIAITGSLLHLFYWNGFSIDEYAAMHIAISATSLIYGIVFIIAVDINEHYIIAFREKTRALADHVNLFEQFAYSAPLACFIFQDNRIVFSNQAASEITGYPGRELGELSPHAIAHRNSRDFLLKLESSEDEHITSFETSIQLTTRNGDTRWGVATFGSAVYDGKPAIVGTILDVTRQKISEHTNQEAEERIRMATNASNTVVWNLDLKTEQVKYIVPEAVEKEYAFVDGQGKEKMLTSIYEQDRELFTNTLQRDVVANEGFEVDYRRYNKNGELKWWRIEGRTQFSKSSRPFRLSGTARCIHDQKIAEEALRENEARLRIATEMAGIQVWEWEVGTNEVVHDADQKVNTCAQVTGFEDFIRRIHPDHKKRVQESVEKSLTQGVRYDEEFPLLDNEGNYRWQHSVGQLFCNDQGKPIQMIGAAIDTTERRKKEELIHFQADLLDKIGQGIVAQNARGEITYLNKAGSELSGIVLRDRAPLDITGLIPAEDRLIGKPEIMNKLRAGKQWAGEMKAASVNGSNVPIFLSVSPLFNEKNVFDGFVGISTDVSAYKEIQGALQGSEEKNRAILNALPDLFFQVDAAGTYLDCKTTDNQKLVIDRDAVIGKKIKDVHEPKFARQSMDLVKKTINTQTLQVLEYSLALENEVAFFEARFAPSGPENVWIVVRDITDRKRAENALVSRSFELQTIADTIPDSILRIGKDLKIKFANKAVLEPANKSLEEFVGMDASMFGCSEIDHNRWVANIKQVMETKTMIEFDVDFKDPVLGLQNYHAFVAPESVVDNNVTSVLAVLRNVTEERRLQQTIIDISARQQRSIGQDLHDELGQLLTGIGFKIAGLQHDLDLMDVACVDQTREIGKLVEQAISQTRIMAEGLNPVTLELYGLRAGLEKLARNTENTFGVACVFTCDEDFRIEDEEKAVQLYRIGQEAVNNAIKHGNPSQITISLVSTNGKTELVVLDDGNGFVRSPKQSDGHGLRIMNYRASVIGAAFQIDSEPDKGTTVRCKFNTNLVEV